MRRGLLTYFLFVFFVHTAFSFADTTRLSFDGLKNQINNTFCYSSEKYFLACVHAANQLLLRLSRFESRTHYALQPSVALPENEIIATFGETDLVRMSDNTNPFKILKDQKEVWIDNLNRSRGVPLDFSVFWSWVGNRFAEAFSRYELPLSLVGWNSLLMIWKDPHTGYLVKSSEEENLEASENTVQTATVDGSIAYLKISRFESESTCQQVRAFLSDGQTRSEIAGLKLDLRDNPGGDFSEMLCVASIFLGGRTHLLDLVSIESEVEKTNTRRPVSYYSYNRNAEVNPVFTKPTVVLVNELSASAAEILAGLLRDINSETIIVGNRTLGKGVLQSLSTFEEDPSIEKVETEAQVFFKNCNCSLHRKRLTPDIEAFRNYRPTEAELKAETEADYYLFEEAGAIEGKAVSNNAERDSVRTRRITEVKNCAIAAVKYNPFQLDKTNDYPSLLADQVIRCVL